MCSCPHLLQRQKEAAFPQKEPKRKEKKKSCQAKSWHIPEQPNLELISWGSAQPWGLHLLVPAGNGQPSKWLWWDTLKTQAGLRKSEFSARSPQSTWIWVFFQRSNHQKHTQQRKPGASGQQMWLKISFLSEPETRKGEKNGSRKGCYRCVLRSRKFQALENKLRCLSSARQLWGDTRHSWEIEKAGFVMR